MTLQLFNTLSGQKKTFKPLQKGQVGMYVCGPTVYDLGHLGHGRSAVSFDIVRKYLIYKGYKVTFVTNYTDIDDKMIQRAELLKISVKELADRIIPEYRKDYSALGIMPGDVQPLATDPENIKEMIHIIQELEKKGYTYILEGDGVYYDVSKFKDYGKLSKQKLDELKSGIRVAVKEGKRNPQDFVLWKFAKPGEPKWESPWGDGRPGWHIECSAMSKRLLGETIDIHGGGADLTFPHHECEIAQSEACFEKPFVRYWLHNGFINVNNEKMSKSLGNFFTLRDIFKKYNPQAVRFLFLQTHYRSPIEFSDQILDQATQSLGRFHDFMRRLESFIPNEKGKQAEVENLLENIQQKFEEAMDDDFEVSKALASCFDLIKEVNKKIDQQNLSDVSKQNVLNLIARLDSVLGIFIQKEEKIDPEIAELISQREQARKNKDWAASDKIRDELLAKGIQLEDTAQGTLWKRS